MAIHRYGKILNTIWTFHNQLHINQTTLYLGKLGISRRIVVGQISGTDQKQTRNTKIESRV